jgi:hypothetical protein
VCHVITITKILIYIFFKSNLSKHEEILKNHLNSITNDWKELVNLWNRIGFKESKLEDRNDAFFKAISEMIKGN